MLRKGSYIAPLDEESITLIFSPGNDRVGTLAKALKLFKVNAFTVYQYYF